MTALTFDLMRIAVASAISILVFGTPPVETLIAITALQALWTANVAYSKDKQ